MNVAPAFRCPRCAGAVARAGDSYDCEACASRYPIVFGIPDFRLRSDRYLSLAEERAKAARLHAFAQEHDFAAVVAHYYAITDDVPPELAERYARYVEEAPVRARDILAEMEPPVRVQVLDVGCGSGGMLVACAERGIPATGVDVALRWLVICQKRLETLGLTATLVCADAAALPFADAGFNQVFAVDLVENVDAPTAVIAEAARQLTPGGGIWLSASNQLWLGPHPSVGLWAAGLWPRPLRAALLRRLRGVDSLRYVGLLSPFAVARACRVAGLGRVVARARGLGAGQLAGRGAGIRRIAAVYRRLRRIGGGAMAVAGPAFEITARRQGTGTA